MGIPYTVKYVEEDDDEEFKEDEPKYDLIYRQWKNGRDMPIISMRELKQDLKYGSCLEAIFSIKDCDLKYKTAYNLAIFPENSK